jgi:hypothetical protein
MVSRLISSLKRSPDTALDALGVPSIVETAVGYDLKIALSPETLNSKIALKESESRLFEGLICDETRIQVPLPLSTTVDKFLIDPKSGLAVLKLKKQPLEFLKPKIDITGLIASQGTSGLSLGSMFTFSERPIKERNAAHLLEGIARTKYDMKENVQIAFVRAMEGNKVLGIMTASKLVGAIFFHGFFKYPPMDVTHDWTDVLDCSYLFADQDNKDLPRSVFPKNDQLQTLALEGLEYQEFKRLLAFYEEMTVNKTPHKSVKKLSDKFKRIAMTPIYDYVIEPLSDENKKQRQAQKYALDKKKELMEKMRTQGPFGAFNLMQELSKDDQGRLAELMSEHFKM